MQSCEKKKIHGCYGNCVMALFILHLVFYLYFFMYPEDKGRKWMIIIVCEEREIIKKNKKKNYIIKCSVK